MTSRNDHDAAGSDKPVDTGDEDNTDLVKRLADNQLLSGRLKGGDEKSRPNRQYGMHDADPGSAGDDEPPANPSATRGSDG